MTKLIRAREEITRIDKEMAQLFERRMQAARQVAEYKQENGMPIFDASREQFLIDKNTAYIEDADLRGYYIDFLKSNMNISKAYQKKILEGMRIAYSGVPGAFAHIAAMHIFESGTPVSYPGFKEAYRAVESGECDCAVLPIENSFAGDVTTVMDLAFFGNLHITGVYDLAVTHNLLAKKGTQKGDIKKVMSHPQALSQCSSFIEDNLLEAEECTNTAVAVKQVAMSDDNSVAAIGSRTAAELYGLEVIEKNINQSEQNTTRFAVFSRAAVKELPENRHFVMFFTVKNEAGSLGRAISVIGKYGFNLKAIKSRPTKELKWEYYFFAEGEGEINGFAGKAMLAELAEQCSQVKLCGTFGREILLKEDE